jgi:hypothetical protein
VQENWSGNTGSGWINNFRPSGGSNNTYDFPIDDTQEPRVRTRTACLCLCASACVRLYVYVCVCVFRYVCLFVLVYVCAHAWDRSIALCGCLSSCALRCAALGLGLISVRVCVCVCVWGGGGQAYVNASLTNLFVWNNLIHDVFYQYGFDEVRYNNTCPSMSYVQP